MQFLSCMFLEAKTVPKGQQEFFEKCGLKGIRTQCINCPIKAIMQFALICSSSCRIMPWLSQEHKKLICSSYWIYWSYLTKSDVACKMRVFKVLWDWQFHTGRTGLSIEVDRMNKSLFLNKCILSNHLLPSDKRHYVIFIEFMALILLRFREIWEKIAQIYLRSILRVI